MCGGPITNGNGVPVPFPMEAFMLCNIVAKFENMNVPKSIFFHERQGKAGTIS
jgi:hypothetical protein